MDESVVEGTVTEVVGKTNPVDDSGLTNPESDRGKDSFDKNFEDFEDPIEELPEDSGRHDKNGTDKDSIDADTEKTKEVDKTAKSQESLKIVPPAQMTEEQKKEFELLPDKLKAFVSSHAYNTRKELSRISQEYQKLIPPEVMTYAKQAQIPIPKIVTNSVKWDAAIRQDPQMAREWLASYGIDPLDLVSDDEVVEGESSSSVGYTPEEVERLVQEKTEEALRGYQIQAFKGQAQTEVQNFFQSKVPGMDEATSYQLEMAMLPYVESLSARTNLPVAKILEKAFTIVSTDESLPFRRLLSSRVAQADGEKTRRARHAGRSISGGLSAPTRAKTNLKGNQVWDYHFDDFKF